MKKWKDSKKKKRITISALLFVVAVLLIYSNVAIGVTEYDIKSQKVPFSFEGFKIVQISDFHNAKFGKGNKRLVTIVRDLKPDIIVITGDFIDSEHTDIDTALSFVMELEKIAPCYYVTGNHESWLQESDTWTSFEQVLKEEKIIILHDKSLELIRDGLSINLIGIDDPEYVRKDDELIQHDAKSLLENLKEPDEYNILLSHRPELFEDYVDEDVDLVLAGHTHGGQIRLPFIGGVAAPDQGLFPKYDAGLFREKNTSMIISRGLGNSILPIRINDEPEVVEVILHHGE